MKEYYKPLNIEDKKQQFRNINLKQMLPILSNTNCDFIDLQFGKFDDELKYIKSKFDINIKSIKEINNFHDIDNLGIVYEIVYIKNESKLSSRAREKRLDRVKRKYKKLLLHPNDHVNM